MKGKLKIRAISLLCALVAVLSMTVFTSSAQGRGTYEGVKIATASVGGEMQPNYILTEEGRIHLSTNKVSNKKAWTYPQINVQHAAKELSVDARLINGVAYVSVRQLFNALGGFYVNYSSQTRTLNIRGKGLDMDITDGSNVIWASGRTLFSLTPSTIMSNGAMYAPITSIAKALSLTVEESYSRGRVTLFGTVRAIAPSSQFYREDEVYWLSRIISSESKGEPLLGQIAVGNVVLNRVKSNAYPNTIWGVIFDRKYGVQFSPVINGTIYDTPSAASVVAAKICLEGFGLSRDAQFFLHPRLATSSWIPKNRPYLFTIGNHDFYS